MALFLEENLESGVVMGHIYNSTSLLSSLISVDKSPIWIVMQFYTKTLLI